MEDYDVRALTYGFTEKDELLENIEGAIFLDVRQEAEITDTEKLTSYPFINVPCMPTDTAQLKASAAELLPDKDVTIIVFCKSGKRANAAKETLDELGYTKVLNAGGFADITYLNEL